jgi:hypothetical protein
MSKYGEVFDMMEHYVEVLRLTGKMDTLWDKFSKEEQTAIKGLATEIKVKGIDK